VKCHWALAATLCFAAALPVRASDHEIVIKDMRFGAAPDRLKVGDTITWNNADFLSHTATARNGAFDLKLPPGAKAKVTLQKAGAIVVFCRYHPDMMLRLLVVK
jgi:plastocyanin